MREAGRLRLRAGFEVALVEPWGSLGVALVEPWGRLEVALYSTVYGFVVALGWL